MKKRKKKLNQFAENRNGIDELGIFLLILVLICGIAGAVLRFPVLSVLAVVLLVCLFVRLLSSRKETRRKENLAFVGQLEHVRFFWQKKKLHRQLKKDSIYKKCPHCKKTYRSLKKGDPKDRICPFCAEKLEDE